MPASYAAITLAIERLGVIEALPSEKEINGKSETPINSAGRRKASIRKSGTYNNELGSHPLTWTGLVGWVGLG